MDTVRQHIVEQVAPVLELHAELSRRWALALDREVARARLRSRAVAYNAMHVVESAGDLVPSFLRATAALERSGLVSEHEARGARERWLELLPLITGWLAGEPMPKDPARAVARRAAVLVASSILHRASADLEAAELLDGWSREQCPCCGGAPDFAVRFDSHRTLLCSRCDTAWKTDAMGCLGCGAASAPAIARIASRALGYYLVICNPCGRYLKEPDGTEVTDPLLERALTVQLDAAAEARGLRL